MSIPGDGSLLHFVATSGDFYFMVPAGTRHFAVRFTGEGELEQVKATILDAAGKTVWQKDNIASSQSFRFQGPAPSQEGLWKLRLERPTHAVFEDHFVEFRGIPALVSFHPDELPASGAMIDRQEIHRGDRWNPGRPMLAPECLPRL